VENVFSVIYHMLGIIYWCCVMCVCRKMCRRTWL